MVNREFLSMVLSVEMEFWRRCIRFRRFDRLSNEVVRQHMWEVTDSVLG